MNPDDLGEVELGADELAAIDALLARPDVWHDLPADLEDDVVAAVAAAAAERDAGQRAEPEVAAPPSIDEHRAVRTRRRLPVWLAATAAAVVVIGGVAVLVGDDDGPGGGAEFALAASEAAPGASADAVVSATPAGLKILLDVDGLPGAPDGSYYEAWISDGTLRVSAGTFHLRRGDNEIELWAGVADPTFDRLSVTLEPLDDDLGSSGVVLLSGAFRLED